MGRTSTSLFESVVITTSQDIPESRWPSDSTSILVSKVAMPPVGFPSKLMLVTVPGNSFPGTASAVITAVWPGLTLPASISSTGIVTSIRLRSPTTTITEPADTLSPCCTRTSSTVQSSGALTVWASRVSSRDASRFRACLSLRVLVSTCASRDAFSSLAIMSPSWTRLPSATGTATTLPEALAVTS